MTEFEQDPSQSEPDNTDSAASETASEEHLLAEENLIVDKDIESAGENQESITSELDSQESNDSSEDVPNPTSGDTEVQLEEAEISEPQGTVEPVALFSDDEAPVPEEKLTAKQKALKALREKAIAEQTEMPFAVVDGEAMTQIPIDLYIPPDALEVFLDAFEGPLDLLLYLIRKQNLDILNINVFEITHQYMEYIDLMHGMQLELAAEYLVMASMLAEIKSRMLLPRSSEEGDEEEEDPRAELIRRLQEYEQFKEAAENMDALPRVGREIFLADEMRPDYERPKFHPEVEMREILLAFKEVMGRADMFEGHEVQRETLSTRQRMSEVLESLQGKAFVPFITLFDAAEGRLGVIVTFLAIMELSKESLIDLVQNEVFAPIHVKARSE